MHVGPQHLLVVGMGGGGPRDVLENKYKNQTHSVVHIFNVKSRDIIYSYLSMMCFIFEYGE